MSMVKYIGPAHPGVDVGSPPIYCAYDVATAVPVEWLTSLLSSASFAPADGEAETYVPPVTHHYTDVYRREDDELAYRDPISDGILPFPVARLDDDGLVPANQLGEGVTSGSTVLFGDGTWDTPPTTTVVERVEVEFSTSDNPLAAGAGIAMRPIMAAGTIVSVRIANGKGNATGTITGDLNKNGTTVFTNQANRPSISSGNRVSSAAVPDVTSVAAGDRLSFDLDAIPSGDQAANVIVAVVLIELS